jgi:hypothetical protein
MDEAAPRARLSRSALDAIQGHDGRVVADEPAVLMDWYSARIYATSCTPGPISWS